MNEISKAVAKMKEQQRFYCENCKGELSKDNQVFAINDKVMCEPCAMREMGSCARCDEKLLGEVVKALDTDWHADCFTCYTCELPFLSDDGESAQFYPYGGQPFCLQHYGEISGSICPGCKKTVFGKHMLVRGRKWHQSCITCSACNTPLTNKDVFLFEDFVVCSDCSTRTDEDLNNIIELIKRKESLFPIVTIPPPNHMFPKKPSPHNFPINLLPPVEKERRPSSPPPPPIVAPKINKPEALSSTSTTSKWPPPQYNKSDFKFSTISAPPPPPSNPINDSKPIPKWKMESKKNETNQPKIPSTLSSVPTSQINRERAPSDAPPPPPIVESDVKPFSKWQQSQNNKNEIKKPSIPAASVPPPPILRERVPSDAPPPPPIVDSDVKPLSQWLQSRNNKNEIRKPSIPASSAPITSLPIENSKAYVRKYTSDSEPPPPPPRRNESSQNSNVLEVDENVVVVEDEGVDEEDDDDTEIDSSMTPQEIKAATANFMNLMKGTATSTSNTSNLKKSSIVEKKKTSASELLARQYLNPMSDINFTSDVLRNPSRRPSETPLKTGDSFSNKSIPANNNLAVSQGEKKMNKATSFTESDGISKKERRNSEKMLTSSIINDESSSKLELHPPRRRPSYEVGIMTRSTSGHPKGEKMSHKTVIQLTLVRANFENCKKAKGEISCSIALLNRDGESIKKEKFHSNIGKGPSNLPEWGEHFVLGLNSVSETAVNIKLVFELKGMLGMNQTIGKVLIDIDTYKGAPEEEKGLWFYVYDGSESIGDVLLKLVFTPLSEFTPGIEPFHIDDGISSYDRISGNLATPEVYEQWINELHSITRKRNENLNLKHLRTDGPSASAVINARRKSSQLALGNPPLIFDSHGNSHFNKEVRRKSNNVMVNLSSSIMKIMSSPTSVGSLDTFEEDSPGSPKSASGSLPTREGSFRRDSSFREEKKELEAQHWSNPKSIPSVALKMPISSSLAVSLSKPAPVKTIVPIEVKSPSKMINGAALSLADRAKMKKK